MTFHHVAIACESLDAERALQALLGYRPESQVIHDPIQRVRLQFMVHPSTGMRVELLAPADESSPLHAYLRRGIRMYHQAFTSDRFEADLARLGASDDAMCVTPPTPATAFGGRRIAFLMLRDMTLVELIEA